MAVDLQTPIADWLARAASTDVPPQVVGLNIGLFETPHSYGIYLACCDEFDEDDSDWASSGCFDHPQRYLELPSLKPAYPK
jgi:hypothetical protein